MLRARALELLPWLDHKRPAEVALYVPRHDNTDDEFDEALGLGGVVHGLLCGATGSGKSTELRRLASRAGALDHDAVVALLRLEDQCVPQALSAPQVLFLIGVMGLHLAAAKGLDAPREREDLAYAYEDIIDATSTRVQVDALVRDLRPQIIGEMPPSEAPPLALPGHGRALEVNDPAVLRLAGTVNRCLTLGRRSRGGAPITLFVDGLDKLDEPDRIEEVFGSGILALAEASVIYAAPIALRHGLMGQASDAWFQLLVLGNFCVFQPEPDGAENPEGLVSMREVLRRRVHAAGLTPEQVFEGGLTPGGIADELIAASGGITRSLIRIVEAAVRRGVVRHPEREALTAEEVSYAISAQERRTLERLRPEHHEPLLRCWETRDAPGGPEGEALLFGNLAHCYANGFPWYRPTPLVLRFLRHRYPDRGW
ncbi:MAG: hypothetical protein H6739_39460 [Alphaproteobacteria bacterium]|nr:hypothetical protein [Alphaproteobacteria bacterium]